MLSLMTVYELNGIIDSKPIFSNDSDFTFSELSNKGLGNTQYMAHLNFTMNQDLDGKSFKDRRLERVDKESLSFNSDHFLADLHDPPDTLIQCLRLPHPHERYVMKNASHCYPVWTLSHGCPLFVYF